MQGAIPPAAPEAWAEADDVALLRWRVCDLALRIDGSMVERRVARLHAELAGRGFGFLPTCYLTTEWLCPDLVPLIGIPFCLAHPRLVRLEKTMMLEVEGESEGECMKLLRHECGHAINYAYRLYRRTRWRELFGRMSADYDPHEYYMRPYSRRYVVHLRDNYAQAHPDEDFAETFAVWLTPGLDWRARYHDWGALAKLEYVDRLMRSIAGRPPLVTGGPRHFAAARTRATLATYFERKQKEFSKGFIGFYDPALRRLFTDAPTEGRTRAHRFLAAHRRLLVDTVADWARVPKYAADGLVRRLAQRAEELGLHLRTADAAAILPVGVCLASLVVEAREHRLRALHTRETKP
ncbi:MAG: hypothetical protein BWK77_03600 [Verrucomicrobia bacterium A1]|nr:MAG: hypothetical protein BWK77_03600 [Verrucomicrobia bacterium A1]